MPSALKQTMTPFKGGVMAPSHHVHTVTSDAEQRKQALLHQLQLLSAAQRLTQTLPMQQPLARETMPVHAMKRIIDDAVRSTQRYCHAHSARACGVHVPTVGLVTSTEAPAASSANRDVLEATKPSVDGSACAVDAGSHPMADKAGLLERAYDPGHRSELMAHRRSHRPAPQRVAGTAEVTSGLAAAAAQARNCSQEVLPCRAPAQEDAEQRHPTEIHPMSHGAPSSSPPSGPAEDCGSFAKPPTRDEKLSRTDSHGETAEEPQGGTLPLGVNRRFLTKRVNSKAVARGARQYSSWVRKADSIRNVISKELSADVADALVLTGSKKAEGKITSLSMVSQSMAQHKRTVAALKRDRCFSDISSMHLSMLASVARTRHHSRYSIVYREGALATSFYLLMKGTIQCSKAEHSNEELHVEATGQPLVFGTEGVVGGLRRVSTAMCVGECELLHFCTSRSNRIGGQTVEDLAAKVFATYVEAELKKMPLFFDVKSEAIAEIARMFELRECGEGGITIFEEGMRAEELYCLAKGRVLLVDGDGTELAKLTAGSVEDGYPFFGQASLLKGGLRRDSATTRTPCKLLVIKRPHFARLLKLMPHLSQTLQDFFRLRRERAQLHRQEKQAEQERKALEKRRGERRGSIVPENKKQAAAAVSLQRGTRGMLTRRQAGHNDS